MDRNAWLAERRTGIGSSDAAAVCGLSPYRSPLEVYLDKLGRLPEEDSPAMEWGRRLEPVVAMAFMDLTNIGAIYCGNELHRHPAIPWLIATPDYMALDKEVNHAVLECKTARSAEGWGEPGTDQIPEGYLLQVQHQMMTLALEEAYVAVLIAGSDFRWYRVRHSFDLCDLLVRIEGDFWRRVEERRPPPVDWSDPRTPDLIALLHRPEEGTACDLPGYLLPELESYEGAGRQIALLLQERKTCKARIIEAMEGHEFANLPDGRRIRRKVVHRDGYTVQPSDYVDFRIAKGGKDRE